MGARARYESHTHPRRRTHGYLSLSPHNSPGRPQELLTLGCLLAPFLPVRSIRPNSPHRRVAHRDSGHHLQVIPPLGESEEATLLKVRRQESPGSLIELWLPAGFLLRGEGLPLARCLGVSFDRREAHPQSAGCLTLTHDVFEHRLDDLLWEVLRICVNSPMMSDGSVTLQPAVERKLLL